MYLKWNQYDQKHVFTDYSPPPVSTGHYGYHAPKDNRMQIVKWVGGCNTQPADLGSKLPAISASLDSTERVPGQTSRPDLPKYFFVMYLAKIRII